MPLFLIGLSIFFLLYFGYALFWSEKAPYPVEVIFQYRTHYAFFGLVLGFTLPSPFHDLFVHPQDFLVAFFVVWFGFTLGSGLEVGVLKKIPRNFAGVDAFQGLCTLIGIWLVLYILSPVVRRIWEAGFSPGELAFTVGAISAVTVPWGQNALARDRRLTGSVVKKFSMVPSFGSLAGVLAAGVMVTRFRPTDPIALYGLTVSGWSGRLLLSLALGALLGISADFLLRREYGEHRTAYLMGGVLALGSGLVMAFHISGLLVGTVIGAWLINATLRRLAVLRFVKTSQDLLKGIFLFLVGFLIGYAVQNVPIDPVGFVLLFLLLLGLRTAVKLLGTDLGMKLFPTKVFKRNTLMGLGLLPQGSLAVALVLEMSDLFSPDVQAVLLGIALLAVMVNGVFASTALKLIPPRSK